MTSLERSEYPPLFVGSSGKALVRLVKSLETVVTCVGSVSCFGSPPFSSKVVVYEHDCFSVTLPFTMIVKH